MDRWLEQRSAGSRNGRGVLGEAGRAQGACCCSHESERGMAGAVSALGRGEPRRARPRAQRGPAGGAAVSRINLNAGVSAPRGSSPLCTLAPAPGGSQHLHCVHSIQTAGNPLRRLSARCCAPPPPAAPQTRSRCSAAESVRVLCGGGGVGVGRVQRARCQTAALPGPPRQQQPLHCRRARQQATSFQPHLDVAVGCHQHALLVAAQQQDLLLHARVKLRFACVYVQHSQSRQCSWLLTLCRLPSCRCK